MLKQPYNSIQKFQKTIQYCRSSFLRYLGFHYGNFFFSPFPSLIRHISVDKKTPLFFLFFFPFFFINFFLQKQYILYKLFFLFSFFLYVLLMEGYDLVRSSSPCSGHSFNSKSFSLRQSLAKKCKKKKSDKKQRVYVQQHLSSTFASRCVVQDLRK